MGLMITVIHYSSNYHHSSVIAENTLHISSRHFDWVNSLVIAMLLYYGDYHNIISFKVVKCGTIDHPLRDSYTQLTTNPLK